MQRIMDTAASAGIVEFGVTDHSYTVANDESLRSARSEFDSLDRPKGFHFGVEATCLRLADEKSSCEASGSGGTWRYSADVGAEGQLTIHLNKEMCDELGIEYLLGEAKWPLGCPLKQDCVIRSYHHQYLFLAKHPLIAAVAHPWCLMGPWRLSDGSRTESFQLRDFKSVPESMHDEFAAALKEHNTLMELPGAILLPPHKMYATSFMNSYSDYVVGMKERGVRFCFGSDSHGPGYVHRSEEAAAVLSLLGFTEEDFDSPLGRMR
jgi:hypothetical protein